MKTFYINQQTCSFCGICAEVCPANVIIKKDKNIEFNENNICICLSCGQCMAVCKTKSIIVNGLSYEEDFFEFKEENNFDSLLEHRRSVRRFKAKPVEKELLQKILESISMSPHGDSCHNVEITIVNNREKIFEALPLMSKFYDKIDKWLKNPFIRMAMKKEIGQDGLNTLLYHLRPRIQRGIYRNISYEYDGITRGAHTIMIFHAKKDSPEHTQDAYIQVSVAMLAAQNLALGTTIIGLVPPAINKDKKIRSIFKIPKENEAIISLIIGYPKYKYLRGIKRKLKNIEWI